MKRTLCMLFIVCLLISCVPRTESAQAVPMAAIDTSWYDAEQDAFAISTAAQLAGLSDLVNSGTNFSGKTILLENDLDLSDYAEGWNDGKGWIPIGRKDHTFNGCFDGGGKTITGLTIHNHELEDAGLFGFIDGGKVNHLTLLNVDIHGKNQVGGICGALRTLAWEPEGYPAEACAAIQDCLVTGTVEGGDDVGGIAGVITCSYTKACESGANVKGKSDVGGVIGGANLCGVENCVSTGTVTGDQYAGGIAGTFSRGSLYTCYATGGVSGGDGIGGIIGKNGFGTVLRNCVSLHTSINAKGTAGRIAGENENGVLQSNAALDSMQITEGGEGKEPLSRQEDQIDGADVAQETARTAMFWIDAMQFSIGVFTITDGAYPTLSACHPTVPKEQEPEEPFQFDDVGDSSLFYYVPVYWAYHHVPQITKGSTDTLFGPGAGATRAQVVTFLWRAAGEPKTSFDGYDFIDVRTDDYYARAVQWAVEQGITKGTGEA